MSLWAWRATVVPNLMSYHSGQFRFVIHLLEQDALDEQVAASVLQKAERLPFGWRSIIGRLPLAPG